ncbi:hypothetical protein FA15DRAFT_691858 [Coprinopsis marcescibilis]|uniref:Uncharacterized protein n=1 Tax=Coprinopsis marcescibilis TaxID=230819 RepID=A0A5C3L6X6_COPMA|nr:hypothetical protein FA15DRAFT_691858 [Coprinopsis marcescibilis]
MSSTSKPLFQEIDLMPGDLTSDDKVVWLVYVADWEPEFFLLSHGLEGIIDRQALERLSCDQFFFYAGDMPDRDPESKERLVLAIRFCPCSSTYNKNWLEQTIFPNNHRAAFLFAARHKWESLRTTRFLNGWFQTVLNVAGRFTFVLVKVQFRDWHVLERTGFNENFGDLIRAGTECMDVDEIRGVEIIKYVLNHDRFWVEEEMIGWNPVVSTKAGEIYKKTLATITPGPLESYPFNPKK